ncbi:MAG: PHP domain-containing protein, partial [Ammonifex sp.]
MRIPTSESTTTGDPRLLRQECILQTMEFVHLHVHTQYSFLESVLTVEQAVAGAKKLGMKALAVTDRGNLFGALKFYRCARTEGIKPIIGCELEVADIHNPKPSGDRSRNRLVLLAKTDAGYRNLIHLVTRAHLESAPDRKFRHPTVCKDWLPFYGEDLTALSGCLMGEIPRLILSGKFDAAKRAALEFEKVFGHGNFYLEIQDHSLPEEKTVNRALVRLAGETGIPLVATNNVRYLDRRDQPLYEAVSAVRRGGAAARATNAEFYFKSA